MGLGRNTLHKSRGEPGKGSQKSFTSLHGAREVVVAPGPAVPTRLPRDPAQPRLDCGQPWAKSSNGINV